MEETQFFDEMGTAGGPMRAPYVELAAWLEGQSPRELRRKQRQADTIFRRLGITFAVYGDQAESERLIPFDPIPRIISAQEWRQLERGIEQRVLEWSLETPGIDSAASYVDGFANIVHLTVVEAPVEAVEIVARGRVETIETHGVEGRDVTGVPPHVFLRPTPMTTPDASLATFARRIEGAEPLERLHALMAALHERVAYEPGATDAATSAREAFAAGRGVCQDHAHVFIAAARSLNIPARYVTGYLELAGEGEVAAHHAWAEAHVADLGWVSFDPANNVSAGTDYVRLAVGLDARGAAPVEGARRGGGEEVLSVAVQVAQTQE